MASDLTRKRHSRAALRTHSHRISKEIEDVIKDFNPIIDEMVVKLRALKRNYEQQIARIGTVDEEILNLVEAEDLEEEHLKSLQESDIFYVVLAKIEDSLSKVNLSSLPSTIHPPDRSVTSSTVQPKLPKLELSKFDGSPKNWLTFWDQFDSAIHLKENMSEVDKFSYLKSLLTDSAKDCISGLTQTKENYEQAIKLLQERYGNPQVLISAHMEALVALPRVKSMSHLNELRSMYDQIETTVRNLRSLKVDTNTYGSLLVPLLIEKLPGDLTMIISRKFGNNVWNLDDLLSYFKQEIQAKERCTSSKIKNDDTKDYSFTAAGLHAQHNYNNYRNNRCVFCSDIHPPSQCSKVTEIKSRLAVLRKKARCFVCLQSGHISKNCKSDYRCNKCKRRHHISICDNPPQERGETHATFTGTSHDVLLQTGRAVICSVESTDGILSRILFDGGSQRSYITSNLKDRLRLSVLRKERVVINTFEGMSTEVRDIEVVRVKVLNFKKDNYVTVELLVVPNICSPLSNQRTKVAKSRYKHLKNLYLADFVDGSIDLTVSVLIGSDCYFNFMSGRCIRGVEESPVALESSIGWVLSGPMERGGRCSAANVVTTQVMRAGVSVEERLDDQLRRFWEVESVGEHSDDDVIRKFEKDITFNGNRYVTKLPFKPNHEFLPDNYRLCESRLAKLRKRLSSNPQLLSDYDKIFQSYQKDGIIEIVDESEIMTEPGAVHYLPHRPVVRQDKETTKVRAVFDASAKVSDGPSLNECLYPGPNLLSKIFDILLRFRTNRFAIISDIKQAFLNIEINEEHRDFLRFLWYDDVGKEDAKIIILRFLRVVFGITSSPFLLNGTIRYHCRNYSEEDKALLERFLEDLYVDDSTTGVESVEEGVKFYEFAKILMAKAGFELRKWLSNSKELMNHINLREGSSLEVEESFAKVLFSNGQGNGHNFKKVLGISWDIESDDFVFTFEDILSLTETLAVTKRNILKVAASFFDPLGLISPIVIQVKIIFQMLCKEQIHWDDTVPESILIKWKDFLNLLREVIEVRVNRFLFNQVKEKVTHMQLHGFSDSSQSAYCAVVYVRVKTSIGVCVSLLTAKTKVAPLKKLSIPRLELLACVLLNKLIESIVEAANYRIDCKDIRGWTDSSIAFYWIKGVRKQWKPWVENRVVKIRNGPIVWNHVSGVCNPADIPTRNISCADMRSEGIWLNGPPFLYTEEESWVPSIVENMPVPEDVLRELKNDNIKSTTVNVGIVEKCIDLSVIDIERFSSFKKLVAVTAFVLRFKNNLLSLVRKLDNVICGREVTVSELLGAENLWIKYEQTTLKKSSTFDQWRRSLGLFEDNDGRLRCRGRLGKSEWLYASKFPLFLSSNSRFTKLLIWDCHERVKHMGVESTLNKLRCRYWVIRGRQVVKKVLLKCFSCRKDQGKTLLPPTTPDLPSFRVAAEYCFQYTGVDFAGPLFVKGIFSTDSNLSKSYICLFTCATSRAIHLELTPSLESPAFIRALIRFISRRGYPNLLISDNAKTFKSKELISFLTVNNIERKNIMASSPWWGGFYERLVRTVKSSIRKTIGKARLTYEEMETVLIGVEGAINSRPLTYLYDDDIQDPITPSHLLCGRNIMSQVDHLPLTENPANLGKRARYMHQVIQAFWARFSKTYLNELREHHMYTARRKRTKEENVLKINDVVIIKEDNISPRSTWRSARVEKLLIGTDEKVRGAELRTISKKGRMTKITRPLQKIIPLEVCNDISTKNDVDVQKLVTDISEDSTTERRRSKRNTARTGELIRRLQEH